VKGMSIALSSPEGSSVEELRRACDVHTYADEVQLSLELADLSFADAAGSYSCGDLNSRVETFNLVCLRPWCRTIHVSIFAFSFPELSN
jgi:hypothetical protein